VPLSVCAAVPSVIDSNCVDNLAQSLTRVVSTGETCTYHVISVSHRRHSARVWVMARIRVPGR
jgi:hypothetical protein